MPHSNSETSIGLTHAADFVLQRKKCNVLRAEIRAGITDFVHLSVRAGLQPLPHR